MQVEGEKQEKYDEGFNHGKSKGHSLGKFEAREEDRKMIISSPSIHIQSKFDEDIESLLKDLEIEKLIQLQGSLFTASIIEEIKELIKG